MEKVVFIKGVQHGLKEQQDDPGVSHIAKTAVRSVDFSGNDPKLPVCYFLAEQIVLGVERAFVESAQPVESGLREQHEHAGAERPAQQGAVLHEVAAEIEQLIAHVAAIAPHVGGNAVQVAPLRQVDGPPDQGAVFQFHVRVNKKNKRRGGFASTGIASDGRQSAGNDFHIHPSAEAQGQFLRAIGGTGVSNEYFGMPHLRVVLLGQGLQQIRQ